MKDKESKWQNFKNMIDRANPLLTILAAVIIFSVSISNQLLQREVVELRQILQIKNKLLVELKATKASPMANGVILTYVGKDNSSLVVEGLLPLEEGKEYRLWRLLGKKARFIKSFSVDQQGMALLSFQLSTDRSSKERLGISIESLGDNKIPEGPMVLLSPSWRR